MEAIFNNMTILILDPKTFDTLRIQQEAEAFIDWVKTSSQANSQLIQIPGEFEETQRDSVCFSSALAS